MIAEDFGAIVKRVAAGVRLDEEQAAHAFDAMMSGQASAVHIASFLTALALRGPTIEEITGGAKTLRAHMLAVTAPEGAIDVVGTGGDGHGTLNVSTATSIVLAGCGIVVAKHGNRAASSQTGAADVLETLGVKIDMSPIVEENCLRKAGLCFLFAQLHHPALKHVGAIRRELGFRTVINILGPLANPANVKRQLLGVYDPVWLEPLAQTLKALGSEKSWVVHGSDGLDEITITGATKVAALDNGKITQFEIKPEDAGLTRAPLSAIKGAGPKENAEAVRALLKGQKNAFRDIVLLNASAGLIVAGKTADLKAGAGLAAAAIDSGKALAALDKLVAASNEAL